MILELFQWLQSLSFMTFIRESGLEYPIVMSTHLTCIAIFGGLIVITDLRLLGWAFKDKSIADVVNGLRWWKRAGFIVMFAMGFTLFGSKAADYYPNPYFWMKMSTLVLILIHAIIFRPQVYNHPEELDASPVIPTRAKVLRATAAKGPRRFSWHGYQVTQTPDSRGPSSDALSVQSLPLVLACSGFAGRGRHNTLQAEVDSHVTVLFIVMPQDHR